MKPNSRQGIVCAGNWIVDVCHTIERWPHEGELAVITDETLGVGGGAANVTFDLHALGAAFAVTGVGCVGQDEHGKFVKEQCRSRNIDDHFLHTLDGVMTAHTHVMTVAGGARTFFYHGGANQHFDAQHLPLEQFAQAQYKMLYVGYLLLLDRFDHLQNNGLTVAAEVLKSARALGLITCVDLVSDNSERFEKVVLPALPYIDFLISNEVELAATAQISVRDVHGHLSFDDLIAAAKKVMRYGVHQAVIVHAPEIAWWLQSDGQIFTLEPQKVEQHKIVSAVGAGDAFCAAVMYGIHEGWSAEQSLAAAHAVAAACLMGKTATDHIPLMQSVLAGLTQEHV